MFNEVLNAPLNITSILKFFGQICPKLTLENSKKNSSLQY